MTKEELKNKYSAFITEISEILGLGKPIDILKLCAATDRFFTPLRKQIQIDAEQIRALQKQNGELTDELKALQDSVKDYGAGCYENGLRNGKRKLEEQLTKAKEIIKSLLHSLKNEGSDYTFALESTHPALAKAEQFLKEIKEK